MGQSRERGNQLIVAGWPVLLGSIAFWELFKLLLVGVEVDACSFTFHIEIVRKPIKLRSP